LKNRIKVQGKVGNLSEDVSVGVEDDKVVVTATIPFSKRFDNTIIIVLNFIQIS
jgi:large subunit ribosomal protein L22e